MIRLAALCAALGIGLSLTDYADIGKWFTVAGVLLLLLSLHRFGRSGPDAPIRFEAEPARKKKRKKKAEPDPLLPPDSGPARDH